MRTGKLVSSIVIRFRLKAPEQQVQGGFYFFGLRYFLYQLTIDNLVLK